MYLQRLCCSRSMAIGGHFPRKQPVVVLDGLRQRETLSTLEQPAEVLVWVDAVDLARSQRAYRGWRSRSRRRRCPRTATRRPTQNGFPMSRVSVLINPDIDLSENTRHEEISDTDTLKILIEPRDRMNF